MKKKPIFLFLVAITGVVVAAAGAFGVLAWRFARSPGSEGDREIIYEVLPGKGFNAIARDLELIGVVSNAPAFSLYARLTGARPKLKAGEYLLRTSMKPKDVTAVITSGKSIARPFTVSEGLNLFEIAAQYEAQNFGPAADFVRLARDPAFAKQLLGEEASSLEGYLFPETYQITKFTTTRELITAMVRRFESVWKDVEASSALRLKQSGSGLGPLDRHDIVTLASIVEKETGAPQERPLISSVFHNRMARKMRLQTDPTIIYGIADETGVIPKNITRADLSRPTKYNTYVITGLPPGPISNPGRDALLAAIIPAESDYLFFVSRNNGTHIFSSTYEDHAKAVRRFQLDPRARQGKSWRDLNAPQSTPPPGTGAH